MLPIVKPLLRRPLMPLLVILQVALACAIACNALFLLQQKLGPILAPSGVGHPARLVFLTHIIPRGKPWPAARLKEVQAALKAIPGVAEVSYAATLPMVEPGMLSAHVYGADAHAGTHAMIYLGDHLMGTLGLHLVAGRAFTAGEKDVTLPGMGFRTAGPVIVTRALAERLYPGGRALGRSVGYADSPGGERIIVGIVAHLLRNRFGTGNADLDDSMLFPGMPRRWPFPRFAVRLGTAATPSVCKALIAVVQRHLGADLFAGNPVACRTFAATRERMLAQPRAAVWLLSGVTLIVLIVTLVGIMGMTGYWVQQRTRSIGIKRALGARRRDVARELMAENLLVVGVGAVLGLVAAYGVNLWLMRHYALLRLPWTYLPTGALLLLVLGQLAVLAPARRAARIPPGVATRTI